MDRRIIELPDQGAMLSFGSRVAEQVGRMPLLIFLRGELGAGKTTFAQGFIGHLIKKARPVLSPTYSYIETYREAIPIHHFDLYRIDHLDSIYDLGLYDHLSDDRSIRLVEWPEQLKNTDLLPDIEVDIEKLCPGRRGSVALSHLTKSYDLCLTACDTGATCNSHGAG